MNQIVKVLMERDGYTRKEAEIRLKEARMEFDPTTDDPEEFLRVARAVCDGEWKSTENRG